MTNAKQKKWLFRALLERNPDLFQANSYAIWIQPVRHFIAQVWVNSCRDPSMFSPSLSLTPLYWGGASIHSDIGSFSELFSREPPPAPFTREYFLQPECDLQPDYPQLAAWGQTIGHWELTVPEIDQIFTRAVEEQVLPLLRPMALDHRAYLAFYHSYLVPHGGLHDGQRMAIALAEGALDEARAVFARLWERHETDRYGDYEPPEPLVYTKRGTRTRSAMEAWDKASDCIQYRDERRRILEIAEPLRTGDRAAIAAILHRWEAEAARIHKVERYWEPTPFPIEEG